MRKNIKTQHIPFYFEYDCSAEDDSSNLSKSIQHLPKHNHLMEVSSCLKAVFLLLYKKSGFFSNSPVSTLSPIWFRKVESVSLGEGGVGRGK